MSLKKLEWLFLAVVTMAQTIQPSNNTADIGDPMYTPRFWLNSTGPVDFPGIYVAPLSYYALISRTNFLNTHFPGVIVHTDASNANKIDGTDFNFVSCDPESYDGGNLDANALLRIITNQGGNVRDRSSLVFYSTRSNHCNSTDLSMLPVVSGVFTTTDPIAVQQLINTTLAQNPNASAYLYPDRNTYLGNSGTYNGQGAPYQPQGPTTAIAMIILYSITGIITALFVVIIITGAVRAHRHPERYGPRNMPGRPRQSRAKGIARAMLETIPIVKFGDHEDVPKDKPSPASDIELANRKETEISETTKAGDKSVTVATTTDVGSSGASTSSKPHGDSDSTKNADGSDESGILGCSICTEDFKKGEEVRVLPCNHKFHPDCVDPWLLNVSGTCPLCRINLGPAGEDGENANGEEMPPPLSPFTDRRSQNISSLLAIAYGSREERITALRRYRAERRTRNVGQVSDEERVSRARRFREALRITTRRHEPNETERQMRSSGIDAIAGPQIRL